MTPTVLVVGAGFSGAMVAVHLLRTITQATAVPGLRAHAARVA